MRAGTASRFIPAHRVRRFCAPRLPACCIGRKTAYASRYRFVGGGYGSKLYVKLEALVAALSLLVRRPVKIALTMEEQFYQITKHPSTLRIKTASTDGRITARKCEVFWNGGAYADIGPRVTQKSGFVAAGPYDIENVWIDSYALYTNMTPAGALRGFGLPQLAFAYESHTDMVARALKRRSDRVPAQEPSARRPTARERHDFARCSNRRSARPRLRPHELAGAVRPRAPAFCAAAAVLPSPLKLRSRRPHRSLSSTWRLTAASLSTAARSTWAKAPIPQWRRSWANSSMSRPRP